MPNLYEYIGIRANATQEELAKAIEQANRRWMQTGEINDPKIQEVLRTAQEILLNPAKRAKYDKEQKIEALSPGKPDGKPNTLGMKNGRSSFISKLTTGQKLGLSAILLVVFAFLISKIFVFAPIKDYPVGCYLLSQKSRQTVAILSNVEESHRFENGVVGRGYEVIAIGSGQREWVDADKMRSTYLRGSHAPYSEWAAPKAAVAPAEAPAQVVQPDAGQGGVQEKPAAPDPQ